MAKSYDGRAYDFGMGSDDFRRASLEIWKEMARGWDDRRNAVWDASSGIGAWLVAALDPQPGETVLELAAGLGDTGFAAATRLGERGRLICTDFSAPMVDAARRHAPERGVTNAEFRTMDAERIDLGDDSVDGVLCRWGYMLMADPGKALRETRRVLRNDGRLALSVWGAPERNPWAAVPARALLEQTGEPPPDPLAPGIFAMAREARTRELLEGAGFDAERVEEVAMTWRFESLDDYWRFVLDVAGALAMVIRSLPEDGQAAVRQRVEGDLEPFETANGYELGGVCLNVLARGLPLARQQ
jgi:ubiquinone/menaquinone biosynthesis C-methylase UbiE